MSEQHKSTKARPQEKTSGQDAAAKKTETASASQEAARDASSKAVEPSASQVPGKAARPAKGAAAFPTAKVATAQKARAVSMASGKKASPRARRVAQTGVIAALYAAATLVCLLFMQGLAWGPVQFRVSEAVVVVAALTPAAVPGLTLGCVVANLVNTAISGTGVLGLLDVMFGSLATWVGAKWCWKHRGRPALAVLGPVIANSLIVPAYLPLLAQGLGFYTIPFTDVSLDGLYPLMYAFGVVATGIGETVVMYALGLPLLRALKRAGVQEEEE